jgi:hypothetical protein
MKREKALALINDLYGLEACYVQAAIDELGEAALSDQAVIWIANQQVNEERRKGLSGSLRIRTSIPTWVGKPAKKISKWVCNKQFKNCGPPLSPAFVQRPLCWAIFRRERIENSRQCLGPTGHDRRIGSVCSLSRARQVSDKPTLRVLIFLGAVRASSDS